MSRLVLSAALIVCLQQSVIAQKPQVVEPAKPLPLQALADREPWRWDQAETTITHALQRYQHHYSWSLKSTPQGASNVEVAIGRADLRGWQGTCSWLTPLVIDGTDLYIVQYETSATQGRVLCVDLATGREKWTREIGAIVPVWQHSAYFSLRIISKRGPNLYVFGLESGGRFLNLIDAATGELVGERLYPEPTAQNE